MLNKAKVLARLSATPEALKGPVGEQLLKETDDMVDAMKRAAPVSSSLEAKPGQFRDSIHAYENPDRQLSYRIIADAKDDKGEFIGPHIEHGHRARDGTHVPASPSFFPTYRARKKPMRRRLAAVVHKTLKTLYPKV